MPTLLRFLSRYEVIFYFLLGIVVVISLNRVLTAWRQWRTALFGLEKESSQRAFNQGLTILILSGFLGLALFVVTTFVTPSVPGVEEVMTPTVDLTSQPTGTATVAGQVIPTATLTGVLPTLTSFFSTGCIPQQIEWTDPKDGDTINGTVTLTGTVNVTDLGYYKYEYAPAGSDTWTTIAAGDTKVEDGPLGGTWDTSDLTPGDYQLRLVVTDHENNALPECTIKVTIAAQ